MVTVLLSSRAKAQGSPSCATLLSSDHREWHTSFQSCTCSTGTQSISIICHYSDTVTELTIEKDASQLQVRGNLDHIHILNEIRIGGQPRPRLIHRPRRQLARTTISPIAFPTRSPPIVRTVNDCGTDHAGCTSQSDPLPIGLLVILGVAVLLAVFWAVIKRGQSEQTGPIAIAEESSADLVDDPRYDVLGGGSGGPDGGGEAAYMDVVAAPVGVNAAYGYAEVQGFTRKGSSTSTTHVQMGADDLYSGIPAESAHSEVDPFGQWHEETSAYMNVTSTEEPAHADVAPAKEYGFGESPYMDVASVEGPAYADVAPAEQCGFGESPDMGVASVEESAYADVAPAEEYGFGESPYMDVASVEEPACADVAPAEQYGFGDDLEQYGFGDDLGKEL